jgi:hypothetical protein
MFRVPRLAAAVSAENLSVGGVCGGGGGSSMFFYIFFIFCKIIRRFEIYQKYTTTAVAYDCSEVQPPWATAVGLPPTACPGGGPARTYRRGPRR